MEDAESGTSWPEGSRVALRSCPTLIMRVIGQVAGRPLVAVYTRDGKTEVIDEAQLLRVDPDAQFQGA